MKFNRWWEPKNDGLNGVRGILTGCVVSSVMWLILIFLIWVIRKS